LFDYLISGKHNPTESAYFVVGDFNTGLHFQDELGSTFYCTKDFKELDKSGFIDSWRHRNPGTQEFSWYSNQRVL